MGNVRSVRAWTGGSSWRRDSSGDRAREFPVSPEEKSITRKLFHDQIKEFKNYWHSPPNQDTRDIFLNRAEADAYATMREIRRAEPKRNPRHSSAMLAAHARGVRNPRRSTGAARDPVRAAVRPAKMPNRGYYIVQADMSYGGYDYGIDAVTPIPWRVWRTTHTLKGYTFQIPAVVYDKPGFKEWAEKNSGPGYPLFVTLQQLRAMTKAFL